MRVGVQGEPGSACDEASIFLVSPDVAKFEYFTDAEQVLIALVSGAVDRAVLAAESPVGNPVAETAAAFLRHPPFIVAGKIHREVHHCVMVRSDNVESAVTHIASHSIPLGKQRAFLEQRFPGYQPIPLPDSGLAARQLSEGILPEGTAVIAMPRAAELFTLSIVERDLPANDNYLTKFVLVERGAL